jgi:hypothetical protein
MASEREKISLSRGGKRFFSKAWVEMESPLIAHTFYDVSDPLAIP